MSKCFDIITAQVCYNNGSYSETLNAFYEIRLDSTGNPVIYKVRFARPDGTLVDTCDGTVAAGPCCCDSSGTNSGGGGTVVIGSTTTYSPDVEYSLLCDVNATTGAVTQFFRRSITYFASNGAASTSVADLALDKTTPYTTTGTVQDCSSDVCTPVTAEGVVTSW